MKEADVSRGSDLPGDRAFAGSLRQGLRSAAWSGLTCAAGAALYLRVIPDHLRTPLSYEGDGLMIAVIIKSIVEGGWYLSNDRLGMPGGLRLHDFPGADNLSCAFFKFFALFTADPFLIATLFFLLTFAFCSAAATYTLRQFGISVWPALAGGILFSFLPYHFFRGVGHLFYSAYFLVPLTIVVAVWITAGGFGSAARARDLFRSRRLWFGVGVGVLLGSNMVYYPFFACFFLSMAALLAVVWRRDYRSAAAGVLVISVVVAALLVNQLPVLLNLWERTSTTFVSRAPAESEIYGLKIAQLLLPRIKHRVDVLDELATAYSDQYPLVNENRWVALGFVGSIGFLSLWGWLLLKRSTGGATSRAHELMTTISVLNAAGVLLGTVGGFSSLIALLFFANIRAYNRLAPFLAFFSLTAVCLALEWLRRRYALTGRRGAAFAAFTCALIGLGCLDQTSWRFSDLSEQQRTHEEEKAFYSEVEAALPQGTMVFQLPYMPFPENGPVYRLAEYAPLIPYLNTESLRWSYAAIKGSRSDLWQHQVATVRADEFLRRIASVGFGAVLIDRRGFTDGGQRWEKALQPHASRHWLHPQQHLVVLDLSGYVTALKESMPAEEWARQAERALFFIALHWSGGFSQREGTDEANWRWCSESGLLTMKNDSPATQRIRVSMTATSADPEPANLKIRSTVWTEDVKLDSAGKVIEREFDLPPGAHTIALDCDGRPANSADTRRLVWRIDNFRVE